MANFRPAPYLNIPSGKSSPGGSGSSGGSGVSGFLGHLTGDIRDAVVGLPEGTLQMFEHPVGTVENMGKTTWHDWSPLFHGQVGKFGHQFYDHPLAPLLDVATVFSGGAALGAKVADKLATGGADNALVNALKSGAHTRTLEDTTGQGRLPMPYETSAKNYRRGIQNQLYAITAKHAEHLPHWFTPAGKYERLHLINSMDRHAGMIRANKEALDAYNLQAAAVVKAGQTLTDHAKIADPLVLNHIFDGTKMKAVHFDDAVRDTAGRHAYEPKTVRYTLTNPATGKDFTKDVVTRVKSYKPLPSGWGYMKKDTPELRAGFEHNDTPLEERLLSLGHQMVTKDPKLAERDASGKALLIQSRNLKDLGYEGKRAAVFSKMLYKTPTRIWKMALVGMSPKMVVDNAVGNWMMYGMRQGGHNAVRGVLDAVHQARGAKVAQESANALDRLTTSHWMDRHFKNELGQSFFGATLKDNLESSGLKDNLDAAPKKGFIHEGFYPLVHRFADQPVRRAAINAYMRNAPEVKTLMKGGRSYDSAVSNALKNDTEGKLFRGAVNHSRSIAGDYHTVSDAGRIVKDLVPFYMWDRHIVRHFGNVLADQPGRVALLQQLSHQGVLASQQASGGILPEFLNGIIPFGHQKGGRLEALSTQGLNPYSTVADLADAFTAATTGGQKATAGEALGGDLNPVLTNLFEGLSGHRIGTDAPVKSHGGVGSTALINMAEGLPQAQLLARLGNPGGNSNAPRKSASGRSKEPTLYSNSLKELITNLLGAPIKDISPQNAATLQGKENHTKKSKKGTFTLTP